MGAVGSHSLACSPWKVAGGEDWLSTTPPLPIPGCTAPPTKCRCSASTGNARTRYANRPETGMDPRQLDVEIRDLALYDALADGVVEVQT